MYVFEINERAESASTKKDVSDLLEEINAVFEELLPELQKNFNQKDFTALTSNAMKLKYLNKVISLYICPVSVAIILYFIISSPLTLY